MMSDWWYDYENEETRDLCTPFLRRTPGSDERILAEVDFPRFLDLLHSYRSSDDHRPLIEEWRRRDRERWRAGLRAATVNGTDAVLPRPVNVRQLDAPGADGAGRDMTAYRAGQRTTTETLLRSVDSRSTVSRPPTTY